MKKVEPKPTIYMEISKKRGKCDCCSEVEWLFPHEGQMLCGMCKQDKQLMDMTMKFPPHD